MSVYTWEHLPYVAGLKSDRSPAKVSRLNRTFFRGSNLQTVAGEWSVAQPANLGWSAATFRILCASGHQPANLGW